MKYDLEFKCACGNPFTLNLDTFKNKNVHRCKECTNKKKSESRKLKFKDVKKFIDDCGCELISKTCDDAHEKLEIKCSCGNHFIKSWNKFKNGQRKCKKCTNKDNEWNFENVKKFVEKESESHCILLSSELNYKNRESKIDLICKCGEPFITTFHCFYYSNKRRCETCRCEIVREKNKKGIDYYRKYVEENSTAKLISEDYNKCSDNFQFKCECGEPFTTSFISFMHGKTKCFSCSPKSKMEERAKQFFESNNIKYKPQKTFDDLCGVNGYVLRFDFGILESNNLKCLIELDGEQHFEPMRYKNGVENFKKIQIYDNLKNEYCKTNNIKLYRISYKEKDKLEEILSNILLKS